MKQKYTWAPQTVHNTPVMDILKGYFYLILFKKKCIKLIKKPTSNFKFQIEWMDTECRHSNLICSTLNKVIWKNSAQYVKTFKRKSAENCISSILSSKRGITPTKIDANWRHSNLICSTLNKVMCKISAQYVEACKRKVWKTVYFYYSKFQKGPNSHKTLRKLTTL